MPAIGAVCITVGQAIVDVVAIGIGINAIANSNDASDSALQEGIEREANRREYKNRCNEKPPAGLDPCERAKWNLRKAKDCKNLRQANTDKWWSGADERHSPELARDLDNAISRAERAVKRICGEQCD